MMETIITPRIQQLEQRLANQIAAGEVIERPASVVKELLENSIDAGAHSIDIDISGGGKELIRIRDDGFGIHADDLTLAVARHATSKIKTFDDLSRMMSLGFRGEALASISSVSRFSIRSCTADVAQAWQVQVEGRDMKTIVTPCSHPQGTTVEVRDLFFNTPARRKFLRSDSTEFSYIEEVVRRIALSHFEVRLHLKHHDRTILHLPAVIDPDLRSQRVLKVFGKTFIDHALMIDFHWNGLRLWGWISPTEITRSQADRQYFYVNGRMVRDRLINHALREAYDDHLYPGRQPMYLLYLELDPVSVDVNVHPTKHEVRFHEGRLIHDFIVRCLREAFSQTPSTSLPELQHSVSHSIENENTESTSTLAELIIDHPSRVIHQYHGRYLVFEVEGGLQVLDSLLAKQTLLKQQLFLISQAPHLYRRPLLIPLTIRTQSGHSFEALQQICEHLKAYGFEFSCLSAHSIVLREAPGALREINYIALFETLFESREFGDKILNSSGVDLRFCDWMAKIAYPHANPDLSQKEMLSLVDAVETALSSKDKSRITQWVPVA